MANEEQLAIVRRGAEAWNAWRKKHPDDKIDLSDTDLRGADLRGADLSGADLRGADLSRADLSGANLSGATLERAALIGTRFEQATLTGCRIHGVSVWDITLDRDTQQTDLVITPRDQPTITVDNL